MWIETQTINAKWSLPSTRIARCSVAIALHPVDFTSTWSSARFGHFCHVGQVFSRLPICIDASKKPDFSSALKLGWSGVEFKSPPIILTSLTLFSL